MATDLIQRAAAICGIDTPNSDQLAAWLDEHRAYVTVKSSPFPPAEWWSELWMVGMDDDLPVPGGFSDMLEALAAAVVEVDRIEREART